MSAFLDGALRPRLSVTLGVIAFALVEIAALCVFVTPDVVARLEPGVLARNVDDDGAALTHALVTAQREPARSAHVALVGASSMREAFWHIDTLRDSVAGALEQPGETTLGAFNLTSGGAGARGVARRSRRAARDPPGRRGARDWPRHALR